MESAYLTSQRFATPWRLVVTAGLVAGTIAALVEMIPVLSIQSLFLGVSPTLVFQSVSSGLVGKAAYEGGAAAVAAGVAVHWVISVIAALIFAWVATRWSDLMKHVVLAGLGFGLLALTVMNALVVPLSAAAFAPNREAALLLVSLAVHMAFFGLPIALSTKWVFRRSGWGDLTRVEAGNLRPSA
jgi:hypothetical protein